MIQANHAILREFSTQLVGLNLLKAKLKSSGGGLSRNEQIYLDDQQALLAVNAGRSAYQKAMETAIKAYQKGITEAQENWQETVREARAQTELLSESEMMNCLAKVGATRDKIEGEPTVFFQEKINKAKTMDEKFDSLSNQIKQTVNELVQRDKELAQQLRF